MLIPSKWYQSSTVSGDLAESPANSEFCDMFTQSKLGAKIDEITDRLCHNIEKIFDDAISRIRSGSGVIYEDLEEDEHQVSESATSELSCGEDEPPSQEDKMVEELKIFRSDRYFYSVVSGLSSGAMVEKANLEISSTVDDLTGGLCSGAGVEIAGGGLVRSETCSSNGKTSRSGSILSVFPRGFSGGGEEFSAGRYGGRKSRGQGGVAGEKQSYECISLARKSPRGMFNRVGAGGSGSGGGPGFYAGETGGVVGCWSTECGPEIMNVVLSSGVRNGDFSSGFSGGSDLDGGALVGGRPFVSGGFAGGKLQGWLLGGFQKSLEREEYGKSLSGYFVGLERKSKMKSSSKGIIVIHLEDIAKFITQLSRASDKIDCHSGFLRMNGLTHLKPNLSSFGVTYKLNSSDFGFGKFRPIHPTSVLKPKFITQIVHCNFPYPQPTNPKSTKTNSTQNSMLCSHDMLIRYSDFPAIGGSQEGARIFNNDQEFLLQFSLAFVLFKSWVRGRESSSDYKPP